MRQVALEQQLQNGLAALALSNTERPLPHEFNEIQ